MRIKFLVKEEYQPLRVVPKILWFLLSLSLTVQIIYNIRQPLPEAFAEDLPAAPKISRLTFLALGDTVTLAYLINLYLHRHDNQPGISIPFANLDYKKITDWLSIIAQINPESIYPHFLASNIYSVVQEKSRKRILVDFIAKEFGIYPQKRWRAMATAVTIAHHHLEDWQLAAKLAEQMREHEQGDIPNWAYNMAIHVGAQSGKFADSITIVENLVKSGDVSDAHEFVLMYERLETILKEKIATSTSADIPELQQQFERLKQLEENYIRLNK